MPNKLSYTQSTISSIFVVRQLSGFDFLTAFIYRPMVPSCPWETVARLTNHSASQIVGTNVQSTATAIHDSYVVSCPFSWMLLSKTRLQPSSKIPPVVMEVTLNPLRDFAMLISRSLLYRSKNCTGHGSKRGLCSYLAVLSPLTLISLQ